MKSSSAPPPPRLMTRAEAKAYCRGVEPHNVCPPLAFGRRLLWDRRALDEALDTMSGRGGRGVAPEAAPQNDIDSIDSEIERARKRIAKAP